MLRPFVKVRRCAGNVQEKEKKGMNKKWRAVLAVLLGVVLVFAFASMAVGCDGAAVPPPAGQESGTDGEGETPGGFEEMTTEERYEALCAAVAAADGDYTLTLSLSNRAGTRRQDMSLAIADGKMIAEAESAYTSQGDTETTEVTSYGLRQGDYFYEKTVIGTHSQTNVSYGASMYESIPAVLDNALSSMLSGYTVHGFYERMLGTASVGADAVTFAFEEYAYDVPDGSIVPEEGGCRIDFTFRDILSMAYTPQALTYEVSVVLSALGTTEVTLPVSEEEITAGITEYDRAYAEIERAFAADTATLTVDFTDYYMTGLTVALHEEQALCEATVPDWTGTTEGTIRFGLIKRDGAFVYVGDMDSMHIGLQPLSETGMDVGWLLNNVLGVSGIAEGYFELSPDDNGTLVLSDAGKEFYNYCESMRLTIDDGVYTLDATLTDAAVSWGSLPKCAVMTISGVGTADPIEFPADLTAQADWYIDGVLYGIDGQGNGQVRLIDEYAEAAVIQSELTVGGVTRPVTTLGAELFDVYEDGYPRLRRIVVPVSVRIIDCTFPGSVKLYYEGTAEQFAGVTGDGAASAAVYCYSETEPSDDGDYWHWNDDRTEAVEW